MRRIPFFSNADRRALLLLEWLLILAVVGLSLRSWMRPSPEADGLVADSTGVSVRRTIGKSSPKKYVYAEAEQTVETFPFDPNTADSTTLLRLGLAPWQVKAIYRYRARHGRYHEPEDFKRLPGMTGELWERLGPCVRIAERFRYLKPEPAALPTVHRDTVAARPVQRDTMQYPVKFPEPTQVDINAADTNLLKKIPGIGSYRARKIVEYRQRLGGFVRAEQIMEACEMPDEVLEWVQVAPTPVPRMALNRLSIQRLMRHPYITFYQARDIVEYRNKHGLLQGEADLLLLPSFSPEQVERLRDYITFE